MKNPTFTTLHDLYKEQGDTIIKSFGNDLQPDIIEFHEDMILKGKKMPIGTISNGYKKVAEGKWQKVSEHGMTKKEHNEKLIEMKNNGARPHADKEDSKEWDKHTSSKSNLDDKDYSDSHVEFSSKTKEELEQIISSNKKIIQSTLNQEGKHTSNTKRLDSENKKIQTYLDSLKNNE